MTHEQIERVRAMGPEELRGTLIFLARALEDADVYLNSYDTSRPSRIKAETRATVAEALAIVEARS